MLETRDQYEAREPHPTDRLERTGEPERINRRNALIVDRLSGLIHALASFEWLADADVGSIAPIARDTLGAIVKNHSHGVSYRELWALIDNRGDRPLPAPLEDAS
jgi:hypothetical protein